MNFGQQIPLGDYQNLQLEFHQSGRQGFLNEFSRKLPTDHDEIALVAFNDFSRVFCDVWEFEKFIVRVADHMTCYLILWEYLRVPKYVK